jgi:hypothetical protein
MDINNKIKLIVRSVMSLSKEWEPLYRESYRRTSGIVNKKIKGKWAAIVVEYEVAQCDCHRCPICERFSCYHEKWCYFTYHSLVVIDLEKEVAKKVFDRMKEEMHCTRYGTKTYYYGEVKILDIEEEGESELTIKWKVEHPHIFTEIVQL